MVGGVSSSFKSNKESQGDGQPAKYLCHRRGTCFQSSELKGKQLAMVAH